MPDGSGSWLPYAGAIGAVACCLALEVLGGAALLVGIPTAIGLSTGVRYLSVVGRGAMLAGSLAVGYHQFGEVNDGFPR